MSPISKDRTNRTETVWYLSGRPGADQPVVRISLKKSPFRIGRRLDLDFTLNAPGVSKVHAEVEITGTNCVIRDLGSTNGTYVNGRRADASVPLKPGDIVQLANVLFHVECDRPREMSHTCAEEITDQAFALLQFDRLMNEQAVTPSFQPIADIHCERVIGFEVLARSRLLGLRTAKELFDAAAALSQEAELSRLMRVKGIELGRDSLTACHLFLNTHPSELQFPGFMASLEEVRSAAGDNPVTLEVHEASITDPAQMRKLKDALDERAIHLAYDDFGAGQARLVELLEVPPMFLKFDRSLIKGLNREDEVRSKMLTTLVNMVRDLGIVPLAEGIETEEEHEACRDVGFQLGQGYLLGRPEPASAWRKALIPTA